MTSGGKVKNHPGLEYPGCQIPVYPERQESEKTCLEIG